MNLWSKDKMMNVDLGPLKFDPPAFDYLGPANAEQRAEIRKSWRTWFWGVVRMYATAVGIVVTFGTVGVICLLLGAANSEAVLETFSEVFR